ncbi:unnamed protein product [Arctogadus glacialis]
MDKMSLDQETLDVLRGRATGRQTPSNMVRVFISSTSDTSSVLSSRYQQCPLDTSSVLSSRYQQCPLGTSSVLSSRYQQCPVL